jgi:monoamine oxidase
MRILTLLTVLVLVAMRLTGPQCAAPTQSPHVPVIVVGGGLAGLLTAYELEKKGIHAAVLEAGPRLGGRIQTADYGNGLQAEFGMQEVWEKNPLLGVVKELGLETEANDDAYSSLIIDEKLYPFIQDTREEFFETLFTPDERKLFDEVIAEMEDLYREATTKGLTPRTKALQDMSYAAWLAAHKLPRKVEQALRLTIEVELAALSEQFSALSAILEWRAFLFGGEKNYHVRGGNSGIITGLASRLPGPVQLNAEVVGVKRVPRAGGAYDCEVTYLIGREMRRMRSDAVVVAVPWVRLHGVQFDPPLGEARWKAIDTLGRGQYTVVHFIMSTEATKLWRNEDGDSPFPILSNGPLGVIYGPQDKGDSAGEMVFGLLVYGHEAQAHHMKPRDATRAEALAELDKLYPDFSKYVHATYIYGYHPASVAYWPPGRSPMDEGSTLLRQPNDALFLAGDWLYNSHSEGAALAGLQTAKDVAAFLKKQGPPHVLLISQPLRGQKTQKYTPGLRGPRRGNWAR